jgi:hypothetical protein
MNAEDLQKKTTVDVMKYLRHRNHVLRIVTGFSPTQLAALAGNRGLGLQESKQLNVITNCFNLILVKDIKLEW